MLVAIVVAFAAWISGCASRSTTINEMRPEEFAHTALLRGVVARAEEHRFQLLVSEVVLGRNGRTTLDRRGFRVDAEYFYPASAIKVCAAVAALQKLESLEATSPSVNGAGPFASLADAPLRIAPLYPGDSWQTDDPSNTAGGAITVAHEVRKLALVSDNQAFNRLYDFVTHEWLNRAMRDAGFRSVVINHRLSDPRPIPDQLQTAGTSLAAPVWPTHAERSTLTLTNTPRRGLLVGRGFMRGDSLVAQPMDFTARNGISLVDLQNLLISIARPDIDLGIPGVQLTTPHRELPLDAMTRYPRESANPLYDAREYPDEYVKFLLPGVRRVMMVDSPERRVQITNKVGQAYGFTVENAYVRDPASARAFFLTAVVYTNEDGILNDDRYEYERVALPVMADLGEWVARRLKDEATPKSSRP